MQEARGLQKLSFDTLSGETFAHQVRQLACPNKRWFHVTKHAARMVSYDYSIEYVQV